MTLDQWVALNGASEKPIDTLKYKRIPCGWEKSVVEMTGRKRTFLELALESGDTSLISEADIVQVGWEGDPDCVCLRHDGETRIALAKGEGAKVIAFLRERHEVVRPGEEAAKEGIVGSWGDALASVPTLHKPTGSFSVDEGGLVEGMGRGAGREGGFPRQGDYLPHEVPHPRPPQADTPSPDDAARMNAYLKRRGMR